MPTFSLGCTTFGFSFPEARRKVPHVIVIDDDMNDAMEENPEEDPDEGSCVE